MASQWRDRHRLVLITVSPPSMEGTTDAAGTASATDATAAAEDNTGAPAEAVAAPEVAATQGDLRFGASAPRAKAMELIQ